ncbi:unnamed protein product, partial [Sphacelaria rigidula]
FLDRRRKPDPTLCAAPINLLMFGMTASTSHDTTTRVNEQIQLCGTTCNNSVSVQLHHNLHTPCLLYGLLTSSPGRGSSGVTPALVPVHSLGSTPVKLFFFFSHFVK